MTLLEYFNECNRGEWISIGHIQYKLEDGVLYFQCTKEFEDWLTNFDVSVVETDGMYIHKGYKEAYESIKDTVTKLGFTAIIGYSLGGVFASLVYKDTLLDKGIKCSCIVYGCPRFLYKPTKQIQRLFDGILRVENQFDLFTHLPPAILGYRHIGRSYVLSDVSKRPKGRSLLMWLTGHDQQMYRQNLGDVI